MAVTTNILGDNSGYVNFVYNDTYEDVFSNIIAFVLAHGWTLHDDISQTEKVLKSSTSGDDEKFVMLSLSDNAGTNDKLNMLVYEDWDEVSHVGVNKCYSSDYDDIAATLDNQVGGAIYIFANANYLMFQYRENGILSTDGTFFGVFGFKPFNSNHDGVPAFGFCTSESFLGRYFADITINASVKVRSRWWTTSSSTINNSPHAGAGFTNFSVPRSSEGYTGQEAQWQEAIALSNGIENNISGLFKYACNQPNHTAARISLSWISYAAINGSLYSSAQKEESLFNQIPDENDAVSGNPRVYTPILKEMMRDELDVLSDYRGRLYGLKVLNNDAGTFGDIVSIDCDSDLLMIEAGGTSIDHMIIPYTNGSKFAMPL